MCGVLALLFIVVPALEIYLIIQVGQAFGALTTLGIIIATGVIGASLAKRQGLSAVQRMQQAMAEGQQIGSSLAEAALVLVAGVLMLTPGFITDISGILLLLPPVRAVVARWIVKMAASRMHTVVFVDPRDVVGDAQNDRDEHDPPPPGVIDV